MIYRLKYAKSESNFDADFEHPTLQGDKFCEHDNPRALPWARSFCPFRACCLYELLPFTFALPFGQRPLVQGVLLI